MNQEPKTFPVIIDKKAWMWSLEDAYLTVTNPKTERYCFIRKSRVTRFPEAHRSLIQKLQVTKEAQITFQEGQMLMQINKWSKLNTIQFYRDPMFKSSAK